MLLDDSTRRIATKELTLFFGSPVAYLFIGTFIAITLFVFFWGETFFARNIADVRPLFEWMPILLIFLTSALTMRIWSEERKSGTLEHILTQPLGIWRFVVAKFAASVLLLIIALVMTLPLPVTVALIGDLDWGPVMSGYIATLFLGAAYIAIGLFVSARSDNQIVSLISAVGICGLFYLIGSPAITDFFGNQVGEILRTIGTGSRFSDITRGVIDVRDIFYYVCLIAIFLALNTYSLERERWNETANNQHHKNWRIGTALLIANALALNLWLGQVNVLRLDTTAGKLYSISDATKSYLSQLQEPLTIQGYFSGKTHPLLAPLVPQLQDLIDEYEVMGNGKVQISFIDPQTDPEQEEKANQQYGIEPVPFQVADRHQSSLVNSYFNVVIQYGDEFEVLGFRDLIEIKSQAEDEIEVQLRNPEYDITRAIKKVLLAYQSGGNLFDTVRGDINFTAYVSADNKLPKQLLEYKNEIIKHLEGLKKDSGNRLQYIFIEPELDNGKIAKQIATDYGFKPMVASLHDSNRFYFYMTLQQDNQVVQIPHGDFTTESFELALESGIKRFASGFTKMVAIVSPTGSSTSYLPNAKRFTGLENILSADLNVKHIDLEDGIIDSEVDVLLLAAPKDLDEKQLFAIDQFLMRGGTVIASTSPYTTNRTRNSINAQRYISGLEKWLQHHGLNVEEKLVMDPQNSAYPVPVTRHIGAFRLQELRMVDYPYFPDIRSDGLNEDNPITSSMNQLSMAWASPITVDKDINAERSITELLKSTSSAWLSSSTNILPTINSSGHSTFIPSSKRDSYLMGVISQGRFTSYFKGQDSPLFKQEETEEENKESDDHTEEILYSSVIEHSPDSSRIILFSSNDFLSDEVIRLSGMANGTEYLGGLELMANTVDWSLEETGLSSIRSRSHFNRTLPPMERDEQIFWESINYLLAVALLIMLAVVQRYRLRQRTRRFSEVLSV